MQQVIVERATNEVASIQEAVNGRLEKLGKEWRIVSAITTAETSSVWEINHALAGEALHPAGYPKHVVYVTTVVVEKTE